MTERTYKKDLEFVAVVCSLLPSMMRINVLLDVLYLSVGVDDELLLVCKRIVHPRICRWEEREVK